jgi:hypothetical protein
MSLEQRKHSKRSYTSVDTTSFMHPGNCFEYLGRDGDNTIRIKTLLEEIRIIHQHMDRRAQKFEYEALMTAIRSFVEKVIE